MVEEALIRLGVDARPVAQHLRGIKGQFQALKDDLKRLNPLDLSNGVAIGGVAAAGAFLVKLGKDAMELAGRIQDVSDATGFSASTLQAFALRVSESGGNSEQATAALTKFATKLQDSGASSADAEAELRKVMDRIKEAKSPVEALTIASDAFGEKMAGKVVNALKDGAAAFDQFKKSAEKSMLTDREILVLDDLSDSWTQFETLAKTWAGKAVSAAWSPFAMSAQLRAIDAKFATRAGGATIEDPKKVAEIAEKLFKAERDLDYSRLSESGKLAALKREELDLHKQYSAAQDGTLAKMQLGIDLAEKQRALEDQAAKVRKRDEDWQKKKIEDGEKQKKLAEEQLEKQKKITDEIAKQASVSRSAQQAMSEAVNDPGRFELGDLANLGTRGGAMARQILWLRNAGKQMAMRWNLGGAQSALSQADQLTAMLSSSNPFLNDPVARLQQEAEKQNQQLAELVRKASQEGININANTL